MSSDTVERTPTIPSPSERLAYIKNGINLRDSIFGYLYKLLKLQRQASRGCVLRYQSGASSRYMLPYFSVPPRIGGITPIILRRVSQSWLEVEPSFLHRTLTASQIDRSFFAKVNGPVTNGELSVDFSDIQNLQILTDKLHQISHILMLNMNVGSQVQNFVRRLKSAWLPLDPPSTWMFNECDAKIEEFLFAHRTHKGRIESMLERSKGISGLVYFSSDAFLTPFAKTTRIQIRTTLDFRAVNLSLDTNMKNTGINEKLHDITKQGAQENSYMKDMVYQSTRDTRSMTIIALITAIFLPATLVAVSPELVSISVSGLN